MRLDHCHVKAFAASDTEDAIVGEICVTPGIDEGEPWYGLELLAQQYRGLAQPDLLAAVVEVSRHVRTNTEQALLLKAVDYLRRALDCELRIQSNQRGEDGRLPRFAIADKRDLATGIVRSLLSELSNEMRQRRANEIVVDVECVGPDEGRSAGATV